MSKDLHITPLEYELIEAWLDDSLSSEQEKAFQDMEKEDSDWALKVKEVKTLREDLESLLVKNELEKIHEEAFEGSNPRTASFPRWIWAVAASLALILVAWWGFQGGFQDPNQKLFEAYYETDPGLITAMSGTDSYEFDRGMVDFKEGKYQEALALWKPLLEQNPSGDTLLYFVGMANLELQNFQESKEDLQKILSESSSEFEEDAKWYLALIYLKQGELDQAKLLLSDLDKPEAQKLLEEIQKES
ncbi:tetratricopeptide repeat protein [uncultured Algoriphagus sp.]|uniref:tetratricopeptide repeat protein n=1 Tax=uncultured Algoriphagus sp. TaxID=417365 RepID=UPI00258B5A2F|nr:tetratricopeptide repeat protein [uncultured Algoriphagus sp.]